MPQIRGLRLQIGKNECLFVLYGTFVEYGRHFYGFSTSMLMYRFVHTDLVSCRISSFLESRSTVRTFPSYAF
jgi:hypothetical protein